MKKHLNQFTRVLALIVCVAMLVCALPQSFVWNAITVAEKPAGGKTTGEPFPYGTAGSNSFRIPSLVTLSDGTLVAAADARWNTTFDGGGHDTIVSRSTDGGDNWSYAFANYLGDNGNVYNGSDSTCFIDPAMAVTEDDTIYMLVDLYPYGVALNGTGNTAPSANVGFNNSGKLLLSGDNHVSYNYYLDGNTIYSFNGIAVPGYTVDEYFNITGTDGTKTNLFFSDSPYKVVRTGYLYLTKSTDKGATWSEPTLLNLKTASEQVCLVGPGRGLVTSGGTIVFPVYSYNGDPNTQKLSFISSTDGVNWTRSASFSGASWSSESAVVELESGALRFFYRNGTTNLCYVDYANGVWGSPVTLGVYTNSNCQISAITYSKTIDGKQVILVSCPTGPNEAGSNLSGASNRLNGKIFAFTVESNGSMTLQGSISVTSNEAQFMYSCLTELNDGTVGILYEDKENAWGEGDNCYYTMSYAEYDLEDELNVTFDDGDDGDTDDEVVVSGEDKIVSNGNGGTAYVLDTDGITVGTPYLIVNTSANGTGYALTNNNGTAGRTAVTIANLEITVDNDTNITWTFSGAESGTVSNNGRYVNLGSNSLSLNAAETNLTISNRGNGAYRIYRYSYSYYYYLNYYSNWSGARTNQQNNIASVYLYEQVSTTAYTVDAQLQENRITAYTVTNDGYTDESWAAYTSALTAAQNKLSEVESASYNSEAEATAALNGLVAAVNALEAAKNALVKSVPITVYYQVNVTTVKTETLNVALDAANVTLPIMVVGNDGETYQVDNTALKLASGTTAYYVSVTKLEGTPISIMENETKELEVELSNGQYVKWSSADSSYVGVAGKYDATAGAYTDTGVIVGYNVTTDPVTVVGTVYNADGTVAAKYNWLVTVTEGNEDENTTTKYIYVEVTEIENCDVYYSINAGELIHVNGSGVIIDQQVTGQYHLSIFATPREGYALTYMNSSFSQGQYFTLSNGNPDGTGSDAWPFVDGYDWSNYVSNSTDGNNKSIFDTACGFRWGVCEGNFTAEQLRILFANAMALGCDGALCFTKNNTGTTYDDSNIGNNVHTSLSFIAQKLPDMNKEITGIADGNTTTSYTPGMTLGIGDTIHYTIKVYVPVSNSDYGNIAYSNINLTDPLTGADWNSWSQNSQTVTSYAYIDSNGNEVEYNGQTRVYTYTTSVTLTNENFLGLVKDGTITNVANLSYEYKALYSSGTLRASSTAVAEIMVEVPEYVIDFSLPVEIEIPTADNIISASAIYGEAKYENGKLIYTPNKILQGSDFITLTLSENQGYGVRLYPATTTYYEEGFVNYEGAWQNVGTAVQLTNQTASQFGTGAHYGYDDVYSTQTSDYSMGTAKMVEVSASNPQAIASFTFTGTGFDIVSRTDATTDLVVIKVYKGADKTGTLLKMVSSDLYWSTTTAGLNQIPVIRYELDEYGQYYVEVQPIYMSVFDHNKDGKNIFYLDALRIYNTLGSTNDDNYAKDNENAPAFKEIRDLLIAADAFSVSDTVTGIVYIDGDNEVNQDELDAFVANGPKNEVYLAKEQSIAFKLECTNPSMIKSIQIGAKLVSGSNGAMQITVGEGNNAASNTVTLKTATDLYYVVNGVQWDANGKSSLIVITNTSDSDAVVSLTNLKITGGAVFKQETQTGGAESKATSRAALFADSTVVSDEIAYVSVVSYASIAEDAVALLEAAKQPVFTPEKLEINWSTISSKLKFAVLQITTSEDVESVIVNGQILTHGTRKNGNMVWQFVVYANNNKFTAEIIAANGDGVVSTPVATEYMLRTTMLDCLLQWLFN